MPSTGSRARESLSALERQRSWCTGLVAPQRVESSQTRGRTRDLWNGRQFLTHWATREVLELTFGLINICATLASVIEIAYLMSEKKSLYLQVSSQLHISTKFSAVGTRVHGIEENISSDKMKQYKLL